jgi:hypothetical protein
MLMPNLELIEMKRGSVHLSYLLNHIYLNGLCQEMVGSFLALYVRSKPNKRLIAGVPQREEGAVFVIYAIEVGIQ